MKFYIAALFLVANVCYAAPADDGAGPLSINNATVVIPPVPTKKPEGGIPIGPGTENSTTEIPPTTSAKPTVPPITTAPSTPVTKPTTKPTTPTTAPTKSTTPAPVTTVPTKTTPSPTPAPITSPTTKEPTTVNPPKPSPSTTAAPATTPVPATHRKFDGPSFVGGIVLASGLMAIGFVAFKFYKARTELNYHTL